MIAHHNGSTPTILCLMTLRSSTGDFPRRNYHAHDVSAGAEPNQWRGGNGQHDGEHNLSGVEGGAQTLAADGSGDDDARDDGDGAGGEAAHPRPHAPADLAFRHDLAGHGAHDAGRAAREEQRQREDGGRYRCQCRTEQRVHCEEVRVGRR